MTSFLGIPYAADPVGELRFAPPRPWATLGSSHRGGTTRSPAVPQPPSRLAALMGRPRSAYAEAGSLTLNIWSPHVASARPVLFWLHGGALLSGSASWEWYDGARLAAAQDIVVVTASYRLGVLGFLDVSTLDDAGPDSASFGLLDQMTALEWVVDNIGAFGGDPTRITVGGQSSGAESAALLAGSPRTGRHVRGLVLQSGGSHGLVQTPEQAAEVTDEYLSTLSARLRSGRPRLEQLRTLPVDDLLAAQTDLLAARASRGQTNPPFGVVAGPEAVPTGGTRAFLGDRADLPVLSGWTRDELHGFSRLNPAAAEVTEEQALALLAPQYGTRAADLLAHYRDARPGATPADLVAAASGDAVMMAPALDLAEERATHGAATYLYRFDWAGSDFGACHCVNLPFAFGTLDAWPDAAMLGGATTEELRPVSDRLMSALGSFVRDGRPDDGAWAPWSHEAEVMRIGGAREGTERGLGLPERAAIRAAGRP